jgi:hypothetical protein
LFWRVAIHGDGLKADADGTVRDPTGPALAPVDHATR